MIVSGKFDVEEKSPANFYYSSDYLLSHRTNSSYLEMVGLLPRLFRDICF